MSLLLEICRSWPRKFRSAAVDLLLPPRCRSCDAELASSEDAALLCGDCRDELSLIAWPTCGRCAAMAPSAGDAVLGCAHCRGARLKFERTLALGSYDGLLGQLVVRMKTDETGALARMFVELWRQMHATELARTEFDVVAPVPDRLGSGRRRGASAPQALADAAARLLRKPLARDMLGMKPGVGPQVGLSREGRFENIKGQMFVRRGHWMHGAHVLLSDDTLTTGATCSEAARALKKAGAASVTVFVVARTPADASPPISFK